MQTWRGSYLVNVLGLPDIFAWWFPNTGNPIQYWVPIDSDNDLVVEV